MEHHKLLIDYDYCSMEDLTAEERMLVERACDATHNAYARYSHFCVGAALLLNDGTVVIGANQENAAFPSGLCAERSAIFAAQSNYPDQPIRMLAIVADCANSQCRPAARAGRSSSRWRTATNNPSRFCSLVRTASTACTVSRICCRSLSLTAICAESL